LWLRRLNNEFGRPNLLGYFRTYEQKIKAHLKRKCAGYHKANYVERVSGNIRREQLRKKKLK